uniref:Uncharacterized protein n=1 Tax=Arundo donax TaxID=35708 RepID=A0A0A9AY75_ARUDO
MSRKIRISPRLQKKRTQYLLVLYSLRSHL